MQEFLQCDEIDQNLIEHKEDGTSENSIMIKDGSNFHWGPEKKHEEIIEDRKKSKKEAKKEKKNKKVDDKDEKLLDHDKNGAVNIEDLAK